MLTMQNEMTQDQQDTVMDVMANGTPLQKANAILGQCAALVDQVLADDPLQGFMRMWATGQFKAMRAKMSALAGQSITTGNFDQGTGTMQPLTRMFGQDLNRASPVVSSDIRPDDIQAKAFRDRRDNLAKSFPDRSDESILEIASQPGGDVLIRSVAKISGVDNYQDADINVKFLADIRDMMATTKAQNDYEAAANAGANDLAAGRVAGTDLANNQESGEDDDDMQGDLDDVTDNGKGKKLGNHTTADDLLNNANSNKLPPPPPPSGAKKAVPPVKPAAGK